MNLLCWYECVVAMRCGGAVGGWPLERAACGRRGAECQGRLGVRQQLCTPAPALHTLPSMSVARTRPPARNTLGARQQAWALVSFGCFHAPYMPWFPMQLPLTLLHLLCGCSQIQRPLERFRKHATAVILGLAVSSMIRTTCQHGTCSALWMGWFGSLRCEAG